MPVNNRPFYHQKELMDAIFLPLNFAYIYNFGSYRPNLLRAHEVHDVACQNKENNERHHQHRLLNLS